jgi:hypothetical protein
MRWVLFLNIYALFWIKIFVQASMNPFGYVAKGLKKALGAKIVLGSGTGIGGVALASYQEITANSSQNGDPSKFSVFPRWMVQSCQERLYLIPFDNTEAQGLAWAIKLHGGDFTGSISFDKNGFMIAGETKKTFSMRDWYSKTGLFVMKVLWNGVPVHVLVSSKTNK